MNIDVNVIVLAASAYSISSEDGSKLEGVSCTYLLTDDLSPKVNSEFSLGHTPAKCSFPIDSFPKFQSVPGVYKFTCEFAISGGVGGKPTMRPVAFDFVNPLVPIKK